MDKPKPYYISKILENCIKSDYVETINIVKNLYNKGYTPNDILLTFMKFLFENNLYNKLDYLEEEIKLTILGQSAITEIINCTLDSNLRAISASSVLSNKS